MKKLISSIKQVVKFYYQGFRRMTWGKSLWMIILIKLFIMFAIFKVFFFQDFLDSRFQNDEEKAEYVIDQLIK